MKISTALLLLSGGVLAWVAFASEPRTEPTRAAGLADDMPVPVELAEAIPPGHVARVFDIEGMCCQGCPRELYKKVAFLDGVVAAAASFDQRTISAIVPSELPVSTLTEALDSAKYTATLRD